MPFLTPEPPTDLITIQIVVPDTLLPSFTGALLDLWRLEHWEVYGTLPPEMCVSYVGEAFFTITEFPLLPVGPVNKVVKYVFSTVGGTLLYLTDDSGNYLFVIVDA